MTTTDTSSEARALEGDVLEGSGGRLWRLLPQPDLARFRGAPWPAVVSTLLTHRGVHDLAEAHAYLGPPGELTDASLMPDLDVAVERLQEACARGEVVAIFGDYDVDGVTATTVLTEGLGALGARPLPYLPDRFTEGYGPNPTAIRELYRAGATLLVTADTGTSAVAEIGLANELGMQAIVIDHHTVPEELPDALALVNPKLVGPAYGAGYGSEPAAVGVAYKVIHDLYERLGRPYAPEEHRALVALGTVCDLAPLLGENRDLVRLGLEAMQRTQRPGLRALAAKARTNLAQADPDTCGWMLGPRLNAAGRMAHARLALDLLLTRDAAEAERLAGELEALNDQRKAATVEAVEAAAEALSPAEREGPLLVVASEAISSGIVGLVASRLVEQHHRPAIVMEVAGDEARGSCRSIPEFDVTALLRRHGDLFERYGGHRAAAGFTVRTDRIPELRERLVADAGEHLDTATLRPTIAVDAELPLDDVRGEVLRWLFRLGPHGQGNAQPTFLSRGVRLHNGRSVGADGSHLQFQVKCGPVTWRAISFRNAQHAVADGEAADIVYRLRRDEFRGGTLQLEVLDLRPAQ